MLQINDFLASINTKGVVKTNKYLVTIPVPPFISQHASYNADDNKLISLRCENATLPGFSFASADGPPQLGYGPLQKHPYSTNFEDISLTFLADSKLRVHQFFTDWMRFIVYNKSEGGKSMNPTNNTQWDPYEVGYKDNYATDITITVYDDAGVPTMIYTLYRAFPMGIQGNQVSWNDNDVMRIVVPIAYTDFWVTYPKQGSSLKNFGNDPKAVPLQRDKAPPQETGKNDAAAANGDPGDGKSIIRQAAEVALASLPIGLGQAKSLLGL